MLISIPKYVLLALLFITPACFGKNDQPLISIPESRIKSSTWSIYVWKVVGWQYDSPYWEKGSKETREIDEIGQTQRDKTIRAVCLGKEGDFFVFFTLRAFVDPAFPNLFVQAVDEKLLDSAGKPFSQVAVASESYIRYGGIELVSYDDQGGGIFKIKNKVNGITHFDANDPTSYGRGYIDKYKPGSGFYQKIGNVQYEIPHKRISAEQHIEMQKTPKISVKYVGEHDVALVYVPVALFVNGIPTDTLELNNPTLSARLMLEHNRELFGFKFVLIGQETIDLIKNYAPSDKGQVYLPGFQKLFMVAGLALGPETLDILKKVDSTLDQIIPQKIAKAKSMTEAGQIAWDTLGTAAIEIARDKQVIAKVRSCVLSLTTDSLQ